MAPLKTHEDVDLDLVRNRILEEIASHPVSWDEIVTKLSIEFHCYGNSIQDALWSLDLAENEDGTLYIVNRY